MAKREYGNDPDTNASGIQLLRRDEAHGPRGTHPKPDLTAVCRGGDHEPRHGPAVRDRRTVLSDEEVCLRARRSTACDRLAARGSACLTGHTSRKATPLRAPPFHPQAMSSPEALALSGGWLRARRLD